MQFTDLLTTGGLIALLMSIVQYIKIKLIVPNISKKYRKFVVILAVLITGFGLSTLGFYLNDVFQWIPDITLAECSIHALEACFTAIVLNQITKGAVNIVNK